jgi:amidase
MTLLRIFSRPLFNPAYRQSRMKRRSFLKGAAAAGTAVVGASWTGACLPAGKKQQSYELLPDDFELHEVTLQQLQEGLTSGKYTAVELVELYLKRIAAVDHQGPLLRSVIELNPDARNIARQLDVERKSGQVRSPLHGIPILIKDNIGTGDKMLTTAGSLAMIGEPLQEDAFLVTRLREAGAIVLGKTNLSEWANFRSTRSTSGWSARGGQTKNPYVLDRNPCGSSSGSAVAVAANLCAAAIGTETDGSIVCPSSANGIVGLKPTLGLWSRRGIIPIAHSQDTAGPMTRSVADAALLLGLLSGADPLDPVTQSAPADTPQDYTRFLDAGGLRNARIGIARNFFGFHEKVDQLMEEAIRVMREQGAEIVDPANITTVGVIEQVEYEVLLYEFKADLNRYLSATPASNPTRTLKDLIAFNEVNREREMSWFGQEIFIKAEGKGPLTETAYLEALEKLKQAAGANGIDAVLAAHQLDALIAPTGGPAWNTDWINGDHYSGGSSSPAACAGYPAITVPAGFVHGLPVGITFMGAAWSEPLLFRLAFAFEQATRHRKAPRFLPAIT